MNGWVVSVLLAALVLWMLSAWMGGVGAAEREAREWEMRADSALEYAANQRQRAEASYQHAVQAQMWADSVVANLEPRVVTLRETVEVVQSVPVPDTCRTVIQARDVLIKQYDAVAEQWAAAYSRQFAANVALRQTVTTLRTGFDSLHVVLAARPKPRSRWLPRVVVGPYAGVGSDLRTSTGIAITAGWEIDVGKLLPWRL